MISALAAPALLLPLLAPRPVAAAAITVASCAAGIEKQEQALEKTLLADFAKCDAKYRADQISKTPTNFSKSAKACEGYLKGALGLGNGSTMDKTFTALNALVGKACDDTSLSLLGHLPTSKFHDIWARAVVFTALDKAYNQELAAASDTVLMFQNMACYPGLPGSNPDPAGNPPTVGCLPGHATTCASCQALTVAPCFQHSCTYLSSGGAGFDLKSDTGLELSDEGQFKGVASFTMCQFQGETGNPVNPPNEYIVIGGSDAKQTQPIQVGAIAYACSRPLADEGFISCGGADGRVDYTTCQDSNDTESTDNAGCPTGFDTCTHEAVDTVNGGNNGGACIYLTPNGVRSGDAYVNLTQTLDAPLNPSNFGTDGLPCTNDDTEARAAANTIGLTTGSASTQNLNTNAGTITNGPISGNPFPCGDIQSSNLSGGKIVGAFPAESQQTLNDEATTFFIGCQ